MCRWRAAACRHEDHTAGPSGGGRSGGKLPRVSRRLGAPLSLKNTKYTRCAALKRKFKKIFSRGVPWECFSGPLCGSRRACHAANTSLQFVRTSVKAHTGRRSWTDMVSFSTNRPRSKSALQQAPFNGVGGLRLRSRTRQPMTNRLALLVHWSVRQKLNRVRSVQLGRSLRSLT